MTLIASFCLQTAILNSFRTKIPNIAKNFKKDPDKYKRNLIKVEIYFDNFNLIEIQEYPAYQVTQINCRTVYV